MSFAKGCGLLIEGFPKLSELLLFDSSLDILNMLPQFDLQVLKLTVLGVLFKYVENSLVILLDLVPNP